MYQLNNLCISLITSVSVGLYFLVNKSASSQVQVVSRAVIEVFTDYVVSVFQSLKNLMLTS